MVKEVVCEDWCGDDVIADGSAEGEGEECQWGGYKGHHDACLPPELAVLAHLGSEGGGEPGESLMYIGGSSTTFMMPEMARVKPAWLEVFTAFPMLSVYFAGRGTFSVCCMSTYDVQHT